MPRNSGAPRLGVAHGRKRLFAVVLIAPLMMVAACSSGGGSAKSASQAQSGTSGGGGGGKTAAAAAAVSITPADGATNVEPDGTLDVKATSGHLTAVTVTDDSGALVGGTMAQGNGEWTPDIPLKTGTKYAVAVKAVNADGTEVDSNSSFTTLTTSKFIGADFDVDNGGTYGVGEVISLKFTKPVKDKAAIEKRLSVTATPAVQGSWSWVKDSDGSDRVDYRPQAYWAAGTKIELTAHLDGANYGNGYYGNQDKKFDFTIGHAIVATADLSSKQMTVTEDGQTLKTLPISAGGPDHPTWGGTMVVLDKQDGIRMDSETVGLGSAYNLPNVRYAVHLTTSGTYVHAAPWNAGKFGVVNSSHGCIGMSTDDAGWFYNLVGPGDVVQVVNSTDKTVDPGNGYGDWNISWAQWQAGSALAAPATPSPSAS